MLLLVPSHHINCINVPWRTLNHSIQNQAQRATSTSNDAHVITAVTRATGRVTSGAFLLIPQFRSSILVLHPYSTSDFGPPPCPHFSLKERESSILFWTFGPIGGLDLASSQPPPLHTPLGAASSGFDLLVLVARFPFPKSWLGFTVSPVAS